MAKKTVKLATDLRLMKGKEVVMYKKGDEVKVNLATYKNWKKNNLI